MKHRWASQIGLRGRGGGGGRTPRIHRLVLPVMLVAAWLGGTATKVEADAFDGYRRAEVFQSPSALDPIDAHSDGRLITLAGDTVYVETAPGSRTFAVHGALPSADIASWGAAFLRVSPDGTRMAIGNNGGSGSPDYRIGVFEISSLSGDWFVADHFDAEWIDDRNLAVTVGEFGGIGSVTALDTLSPNPADPTNPVIVENIGGASGGVAFDQAGNLFTGNGYELGVRSSTGSVMAIDVAEWTAALEGGAIPDFEVDGVLIVDVLSASPLGFDSQGNLFVGGGGGEAGFVALVRSTAVADALAGMDPADIDDPTQVRRLDPYPATDGDFYSVYHNDVLGELYLRDYLDPMVHVYEDLTGIPTVSSWGLGALTLLLLTAATLTLRRQREESAIATVGCPPCLKGDLCCRQ